MTSKKQCKLEENMKIRNKLLSLGIGYANIGPRGATGPKGDKGPKGDQGPTGPKGETPASANQSIMFASFLDTNTSNKMNIDNTWLIPNISPYFSIKENEIEILPGIYEINFSGTINEANQNHGAELYLKTKEGSAIKDLFYELKPGKGIKMHFSQSILFRFDTPTTLQVETNINGDATTSNITIENVTLLMKKIQE